MIIPTTIDKEVREKMESLFEYHITTTTFAEFLARVFSDESLNAEGSDAGTLFVVWTAFEVAKGYRG